MVAECNSPLVAAKPGGFVRRLADLDAPRGRSKTADAKLDAMGIGHAMLMCSVNANALCGAGDCMPASRTQEALIVFVLIVISGE